MTAVWIDWNVAVEADYAAFDNSAALAATLQCAYASLHFVILP